MRRVRIPFTELPGKFRQYAVATQRNTNMRLDQAMLRVRHIVTVETAKAPPASARGSIGAVDTGRYLRNWNVYKAAIAGMKGILITNSSEYMAVIERGRGLGKKYPPTAVIASWAQRKLGLPYAEAQRAAFPIARAIGRRGLYARRVMTGNPAKNSYRKTMFELMGLALDDSSIQVFR